MIDMQLAVGSLMTLLLDGGASAAKELIKGVAVKGAVTLSKVWQEILTDEPKAHALADRVAKEPDNASANQELRSLLEACLKARPELVQQAEHAINIGEITATDGGVAVGVMNGGQITVTN